MWRDLVPESFGDNTLDRDPNFWSAGGTRRCWSAVASVADTAFDLGRALVDRLKRRRRFALPAQPKEPLGFGSCGDDDQRLVDAPSRV